MLAEQALVRLVELRLRLDDQEEVVARLGDDAVRHGAGKHQVVALLEGERTEIGLDRALAAMDEDQLVAIGVAIVERHRLGAPRDVQRDVVVAEKGDGHALRVAGVGRLELVQVEECGRSLPSKRIQPVGGCAW